MESNVKRLYRSRTDKKLGGVCGGLGDYFQVDSTIMRIIFIVFTFFSVGLGFFAYLLMWVVMPEEPKVVRKKVVHRAKIKE